MERIVEAFITVITASVSLLVTLFMVNLICAISRIILQKWNRLMFRRPIQIINGKYGPVIFPNTGDKNALYAFITEQCKLADKAMRRGDEKRGRHHVANMYLAFKDPMAVSIFPKTYREVMRLSMVCRINE